MTEEIEQPTELDLIKQYLRIISISDDDNLLAGFISAAKALIADQTGKDLDADNELYKLAVKFLVSHWYDSRAIITDRRVDSEVPYSARTLIEHLSLCGTY